MSESVPRRLARVALALLVAAATGCGSDEAATAITLTSGPLTLGPTELTIQGSTNGGITIRPGAPFRILDTAGRIQTLTLRNLTITGGQSMRAKEAERYSGPADPSSCTQGQARIVRGSCLTGLSRFDEAERDLRAGRQILEKVLGPTHTGASTRRRCAS